MPKFVSGEGKCLKCSNVDIQCMLVGISTKITKEDKDRIRAFVNKGMFPSFSEFYRTAVHRFLKELDEYQEKKKQAMNEAMNKEPTSSEAETDEKELEELQRFVDELY